MVLVHGRHGNAYPPCYMLGPDIAAVQMGMLCCHLQCWDHATIRQCQDEVGMARHTHAVTWWCCNTADVWTGELWWHWNTAVLNKHAYTPTWPR